MGVNGAPAFNGTGEIAVTFNGESYDTDAIHSNVTNNSRFTVPAGASKIRVQCGFRFSMGGTGGLVHTRFVRNGLFTGSLDPASTLMNSGQSPNQGAGSVLAQHLMASTGVLDVSPGDYFEFYTTVQGNTATIHANTAWFQLEILE